MTLAPLWFVGLQDFTNSVAVTLDRKEETPFLPLLFSCLFNFRERGQYMAFHSARKESRPLDKGVAGIVAFVQQNREERGGRKRLLHSKI